MAKSIEDILGWAPLTEAMRTTRSEIPNPFDESLFKISPRGQIMGDVAQYTRLPGERRVARRNMNGAPPRTRKLKEIGAQPIRLLAAADEFKIDTFTLQKLRKFEEYVQDGGVDWVGLQIESIGKLVNNLEIASMAQMLLRGILYFDSEGMLLGSSSGADTNLTIDAGIPATHKDQINGILTHSWSSATADIPTMITNVHDFSLLETGMPLIDTEGTVAYYGANIPGYIQRNAFSQSWLARNPMVNQQYMRSPAFLPRGLFGIDRWERVYTFYEDDDGNKTTLWDPDVVTILPSVSQPDKMNWWASYEGSHWVPKSFDPVEGLSAAMSNGTWRYGKYSYAWLDYPHGQSANVTAGHTFLRIFKNEKAPFMLDVNF